MGLEIGNSGAKAEMLERMCDEISPRTGVSKNLEKMNVMNFIKKNPGEKMSGQPDINKNFNRQGSKKLIQGAHFQGPLTHLSTNKPQSQNFGTGQFIQNKHNFTRNAGFNAQTGGEYEYDIELPAKNPEGSNGTNPSSVIGHYNEMGGKGNSGSNYNLMGNLNVKMSMMKMGVERDIRDHEMDMSPKSSKNDLLPSQNQSWKPKF
jgi:hypothetical protein